MDVFIQKDGKTVSGDFRGSVADLLARLEVNPEFVIVVIDGVLCTSSDKVDGAKRIELLSVVSGG